MTSEKSTDGRWDMHTDRQITAAKGGALAVTILNSGSWLALLSQVSNLSPVAGPRMGHRRSIGHPDMALHLSWYSVAGGSRL